MVEHVDLAAGKNGPVPYKAIIHEWKEYVDPKYFPKGISLKDPSKYVTEESNSILKLWRARRDKGEVYFKFKCILGGDKLPAEPDYADGMFEDLHPATQMDLDIHRPACEDVEEENEDSDDDEAIPNRIRIRSPEESGGSNVGEPVKDVPNSSIPKRYRLWLPEEGEESDLQDQDSNAEERAPGIDEDDEVDHIQNLNRGRSGKRRVLSVESDKGLTGPTIKTTPRAPRRREISPTFESSPTLAGSSPSTQMPIQPRQRTRGRTKAAADMLLNPEASVQSPESSPEKRQLRPRWTATVGTGEVAVVAKRGRGKGKKS